jgi:hypothetical protein
VLGLRFLMKQALLFVVLICKGYITDTSQRKSYMKRLVFVKKISKKAENLSKAIQLGVSKFLPQKKDDDSFIQAVETVDFPDDDFDLELQPEQEEQIDNNLHQVTPKVQLKPQPEVHMLSNVEDILQVPTHNLDETISEINETLQRLSLEQERLTALLGKARERQEIVDEGKKIIAKIISGEDYNSNLLEFDDKLRKAENIHTLLKDFLVESQQQIENAPLDKRCTVVFEFSRDERLLKYLKALYGFKCQICSFTFEQEGGGFYADTYYLEALSDGGADNLENLIVLCPNHKKMLQLANISIRYARKEEVCLDINGKQHIIKRIPLR